MFRPPWLLGGRSARGAHVSAPRSTKRPRPSKSERGAIIPVQSDEGRIEVDDIMPGDERAIAVSLEDLLGAHDKYRAALLEMLQCIGLEPHEGRSPEIAFARVLVASVVGGTPLPQGRYERYQVLGRDGCRIAVYTADDMSSAVNGWVVDTAAVDGIDAVALVMFIQHRPSAVHLIPVSRVASLCAALGDQHSPKGSLTLSRALNDNLVMEPVVSAALGVVSTLLP